MTRDNATNTPQKRPADETTAPPPTGRTGAGSFIKRNRLTLGALLLFAVFSGLVVYYFAALNLPRDDDFLEYTLIGCFYGGLLLLLFSVVIRLTRNFAKKKVIRFIACFIGGVAVLAAMLQTGSDLYYTIMMQGRWSKLGGTWEATSTAYNFNTRRVTAPFAMRLTFSGQDRSFSGSWWNDKHQGRAIIWHHSFRLENDKGPTLPGPFNFRLVDQDTMILEPQGSLRELRFLFFTTDDVSLNGDSITIQGRPVVWKRATSG